MSGLERYFEKLVCPACSKSGMVEWEQGADPADAEPTSRRVVLNLSEGFRLKSPRAPSETWTMFCTRCKVQSSRAAA